MRKIFWLLLIFYLCTQTAFAKEYLYPFYKKIGNFFQEIASTGSPPPRLPKSPQHSSEEYPHVTQKKAAAPQQNFGSRTTTSDFSHNYKGDSLGSGGSTPYKRY